MSHNNYSNGHTFLPRRKLLEATAALLQITVSASSPNSSMMSRAVALPTPFTAPEDR